MIARALAQEPSLLLLDEPTAFLDVPSRVELMGLLRHLARVENLGILLSTHDLELALRTADTIWLVAPGGHFYCGSPEDIVMAGHLATAFESENIRFQPEERAFRLLGGTRGQAAVRGDGLAAILAGAVLHREGYEVVREGVVEVVVTIRGGSMWEIASGDQISHGKTFAELAQELRGSGK
jgi:iron complex transport system ATP-binding protein